jgi:hypothetical protein
MNRSRSHATVGPMWTTSAGRRAAAKAVGGAVVGLVTSPGWGAPVGHVAAKGARDHPAIVALSAVLADAARELDVPLPEIAVQSLQAEEWPDACLGLAAPDEACAEVITPGYRIIMRTADEEVSYRADQRGVFRREPAAVSQDALQVHFERTGGIAGRHDEIDLDAANLSDAEASELRRLIEDADFWNLPEQIDEDITVTDGYEYRVTVSEGSRSHTVSGYGIASLPQTQNPGFWRLVSWLEERIGTG